MDTTPRQRVAGGPRTRPGHQRAPRVAGELSPIDRRLVRALQADGRAPYARISRELGLTEKIIRGRVRELRGSGVIDIITVVNPSLAGYRSLALAGVRTTGERPVAEVAAALAEQPSVSHVALTAGRYHILAEVACRDLDELLRVLDAGIGGTEGVGGVESHPFLRLYAPEPGRGAVPGPRRQGAGTPLDGTDLAIIRHLDVDGRMPYGQIAGGLGISESAVRQRVNRMRRTGMLLITAVADPATLGFTTSSWLGVSVSPGISVTKVADALVDLPAVTYLAVCGGRFDILAEAVCRDNDDLLRVVDHDVRQIHGVERVELSVFSGAFHNRLPLAQGR